MDFADFTVKRAATLLGYGVLGAASTAVTAFVVLNVAEPIQRVVYDFFYLQVGPSKATETAILTHFLLAGVSGLGLSMVIGDYLSDRGANRGAIARGIAALLALLVVFLVVALAGLAAYLTAMVVLTVGLIGIPLVLWYQVNVHSGGLPAFAGGVPVVVLLVFLGGFGIAWGWGYVVIAEEIPAGSPEDVVDFNEVPEVRDDLFVDGECETTGDGTQRCILQLRGYAHEQTAVRFMARHGVRCPYPNTYTGEEDTLVAEYDGSYYRVSCSAHGD